MAIRDIDLNLTNEQKNMRDMVRKFGREAVRPAGIALDKMHNPADAIAKGSVLWDVYKKYRKLGLHKIMISQAAGGMAEDVDTMSKILVLEEMGYADSGLAISLGVDSMPFVLAAFSPDPEVQGWARQFCNDTKCNFIGCWAITEPDHGSDWITSFSEKTGNPGIIPNVRAVLKGDEYIINGQKSAWVSNGSIATHANLHVCLEKS